MLPLVILILLVAAAGGRQVHHPIPCERLSLLSRRGGASREGADPGGWA
ncbi:MAG TPA: hypothetical protein VG455_10145 [Acidimicrobiales bacterium]|nr:hypothetical protein [Acidimicrobiales bacterium]